MNLDENERKIADRAIEFIYSNENLLIERFANDKEFPSQDKPISFFTAGSFGAGKTEFSRRLSEKFPGLVLIDADEIRKLCPEYDGERAYIFNSAAFIGQDKLLTYAFDKNKSFVFDSSFSSYKNAKSNIDRSLVKKRPVEIYYVFQDPKVAWFFTQVRAELRGRFISKHAFIKSVLSSRETAENIKKEFGKEVSLHVVRKSIDSDVDGEDIHDLTESDLEKIRERIITRNIFQNIDSIDNYVNVDYSEEALKKIL